MIEIANWVANLFLLGIGSVFFAIGLFIAIGIIAERKDIFRRPFIPKTKEKPFVG